MGKSRFLALAFIVLAVGCAPPTVAANPPWVSKLIAEFQAAPAGNPPQSIWQVEYAGRTVYYIPPQCCDMFGALVDAQGTVICAPDGGLDGRGDGRCPDFRAARKNERLVWKDSRTR